MDFYTFLIDKLNIDVIIVAIVFLSGFFQDKYLGHFTLSKDSKYDSALKTLAVSFIASVIYIFLIYHKGEPLPVAKYFISYFSATSLYDMVIKPIAKMISNAGKKISGDEQNSNQ